MSLLDPQYRRRTKILATKTGELEDLDWLKAKFEEAGGIDLIVIYNSGRFRMAGHGSLAGLMPYGDANAIVLEMAAEVLPVVKRTPVLAGVCGTDPMRLMVKFLEEVGYAGNRHFDAHAYRTEDYAGEEAEFACFG